MDSARLLRQMNNILFSLLTVPDPALRQPITLSAVAPLFICYYVLAFLVQLPQTFALKLSLLPIVFWTAWNTATRYDLAMKIMLVVGTEDYDSFRAWNYALVVSVYAISQNSSRRPAHTVPDFDALYPSASDGVHVCLGTL